MYQSNIVSKHSASSHKKHRDSPSASWGSHQLDFEYLQIRDEIVSSEFYKTLQKQAKIRLNGWVTKLDSIIANPVWKKNRNTYAKLINLMCQCQVLIQPFTAMPPHSDISTLNKHEINAIIDQVELAVKKNTMKTQSWLKEQLKQQVSQKETPKEHWSRVRHQRQKSKLANLEDSSINLGRFTEFAAKNSDKRYKELNQSMNSSQQSIKSLPLRMINLSIQKENIRPQSIKYSKNSQQQKQNKKINTIRYEKVQKNVQNSQAQLKLKHSQVNLSNLFCKNKRIETNYTRVSENEQPPLNFRDQHESIQLADDTLKTEAFYSQAYEFTPQDPSVKMNQSHLTDCNFSDQFSERCKTKEEVLIKNYFSWKKPSITVQSKPLVQIQLKPMQPLPMPSERGEPSNSVTIETILQNAFESNVVGQQSKALSSNKSNQKHYWQSESVSSEFPCREEGETIQINECEYEQIGEQGKTSMKKKSISS